MTTKTHLKVLTHASDCPQWEVVESKKALTLSDDADLETATQADDVEPSKVYHYLRCVTTGKFYPIHIEVPEHDHLTWVDRK
jgi:hypothetical protein